MSQGHIKFLFLIQTGELLPRALPPLIITEFLLGVLGNGLALWVFCWHMRPWKSSTVLLFNLALADFLLNAVSCQLLPLRTGLEV
ncbi:hypothetical protein AALO_G00062880 [Alosa alosa]|uniref:Uncharacterized protein n=1 Tax=Alosa alosa TaxID=278164 RepID=A0AAV6H4I8_9TELE|nr:hypothetical protein AALO_G00062880 [Alosa alosa]